MSNQKQKPKENAFSVRFTRNDTETIDLSYGKIGGEVHEKPRSLERVVIDYTEKVLKEHGKTAVDLPTLKEYEQIGEAINQSTLLGKTSFRSVKDLLAQCH